MNRGVGSSHVRAAVRLCRYRPPPPARAMLAVLELPEVYTSVHKWGSRPGSRGLSKRSDFLFLNTELFFFSSMCFKSNSNTFFSSMCLKYNSNTICPLIRTQLEHGCFTWNYFPVREGKGIYKRD